MRNLLDFLTSRCIVVLIALLALASAACAAEPQPPQGFAVLFNGKDLTGWHGMPHFDPYQFAAMSEADRKSQIAAWTEDAKQHWSAKDGDLVNDGHGVFLTTDKEYGDMELLIEYKTVPKADSGIYLRATPQVQIWDHTNQDVVGLGADKGSGGLWNNSPGAPGKDPLVMADKPFGEWNSFRILQIGERVTVYLNGKLVVDHARQENFWNRKLPLLKQGPIQLQTHGGEICWRNIFIREIPSDEANQILRTHGSTGFVDVFDGKTLAGWAGPVDQHEIKNGAIMCKPEKGGTIYTNEEFMANAPHPGKDRVAGHFGFCGHNDPVAFRAIQIKRLESK